MGPVAPRDPEKKRDFYYIMLEKQIFAGPADNGRGICFLYQSDGRLLSSSRIVGNITDESMLELLKTTEGFKKLVYSIGVSMQNEEGLEGDFCFQFYGKKDPYVTGTTIRQRLTADGAEHIIKLGDVTWSDDDDIPGQIRFEFDRQGIMCTINIRFYLQDGFSAPEFEGIDPVDTTSSEYARMIAGSFVSEGKLDRLSRAIARARAGEEISIAFIGGSITQGAGATPINTACYAYKTYEHFCELVGRKDNIRYIKAGVGGTSSELGIVRYEKDVLAESVRDPDIAIIEYAVNDYGDETNGECYEGLVRRIYGASGAPAVILLFSVFADDSNLEERLIPIGRKYELPMVSIKAAVTEQFYKKRGEGRVLAKNRFFYDSYHPANIGHIIMADCLGLVFDRAASMEPSDKILGSMPKPLMTSDFDRIRLMDRKNHSFMAKVSCGGFTGTDTDIQCVERNLDLVTTPEFANNWKHEPGAKSSFTMQVYCKSLFIVTKDSSSALVGCADVYVDGIFVKTVDPHEVGWTHCNSQLIIREKWPRRHTVEIMMKKKDEDKLFTILGFGIGE